MREYKFRGVSKETNEFVYGDPITDPKTNTISCILEYKGIPRKFIEIKTETLGQFTGLKDKNGVDVYEGDIIKSDHFTKHFFISFGKSEKWGACFCVQSYNSIIFLSQIWCETSEIIGNIHQNPELLETK